MNPAITHIAHREDEAVVNVLLVDNLNDIMDRRFREEGGGRWDQAC